MTSTFPILVATNSDHRLRNQSWRASAFGHKGSLKVPAAGVLAAAVTSLLPSTTVGRSGERKATDTNFAASRPAAVLFELFRRANASRTGMAAWRYRVGLHYGAAAFAVALPSRNVCAPLLSSPCNTDGRHAERAKTARLFFLLTLNRQVRRA
jgi:hypothetical protein